VCRQLEGKVNGVTFVRCESPLEILDYADADELYILDAVSGIGKVSLFPDMREFGRARSVTAHDQDLGLMLKLMSAAGNLPPVKIIGIPVSCNLNEASKDVRRILTRISKPKIRKPPNKMEAIFKQNRYLLSMLNKKQYI